MDQKLYRQAEACMKDCLKDSAHDPEHVYRVLYQALDLAQHEQNVNTDLLILACLLHDIGREKEYQDPSVCHAAAGAEMAYEFLLQIGLEERSARFVKDCIRTHRYRRGDPPASLEAQILFDADKLDVAGTIGIARTLLYKGAGAEPLYALRQAGKLDGDGDIEPAANSFWKEYHQKLTKLYGLFFTERAKQIAQKRKHAAEQYFEHFREEVWGSYRGSGILNEILNG